MTLEEALARLQSIHSGERPYLSDRAFSAEETDAVVDAARKALADGGAALAPTFDELFHKASLAPGAAKTMPSQALAIALGKVVEASPTSEAILVLGNVVRKVRHAGIKKKLQRNLRAAERALSQRPEVALRLPRDRSPSKVQASTFKRALEAGFSSDLKWTFPDWRECVAEHPYASTIGAALIWHVCGAAGDTVAVMPSVEHGRLTLRDVSGADIPLESHRLLGLWHPIDATAAERAAWRDRIVASRVQQPFKQAFREFYRPSPGELGQRESALFSEHVISLRPFLSLAHQQGWRIVDDFRIARSIGEWTLTLDLDTSLHPGAVGCATTRTISVWCGVDPVSRQGAFDKLPPVALSETLRSIDLLVSTSGFGIEPSCDLPFDDHLRRHRRLGHLAEKPLGAMAEMRKEALSRILQPRSREVTIRFDARHIYIGSFAIHLATGRVTHGGEDLSNEPPRRSNLTAVPWLPYDEKLLEFLALTALDLIGRCQTGSS